ncbi:MAG: twin-arginine translocation protein TatA/E family subunit [Verrucomicrobiales bacterium]|nr:twin-arginine translocation protein TatA/E family subunit [Verrucomicrobiales bacterium]
MNAMLAAFAMGGMEIVLIIGVIILLFGARRLPGLFKGMGESVKEFKKASKEDQNSVAKKFD